MLVKLAVFIISDDRMENKSFEIEESMLDVLLDMLNTQDIERLNRFTQDTHIQKQEILRLERENTLLKRNLGIVENTKFNSILEEKLCHCTVK